IRAPVEAPQEEDAARVARTGSWPKVSRIDAVVHDTDPTGAELVAEHHGVQGTYGDNLIDLGEGAAFKSLELAPLLADVPAPQAAALVFVVALPDQRLDIVSHHKPPGAASRGKRLCEWCPLAVPQVHGVSPAVGLDGVEECATAVRRD